MHRLRLLVAPALAGLLLCAWPASAAPADSDARQAWAVVPATAKGPDGRGVLEYVAEPGATQHDRVAVRNFGDDPLTVSLYAQDATQTTENAFELLTPEEPARGVGAWIRLEQSEVTVPPRETVVVAFTLKLPDGAEPGDHAGGIVAVNQAAPAEGGPAVQYRVGTRVYLRVGGPVTPGLELLLNDVGFAAGSTPIAPGVVSLDGRLTNTGNVRLTPTIRVRASTLFEFWSAATVTELGEILPAGTLATELDLPDVPPLGPLWVTAEVIAAESNAQDVSHSIATPPRTMVVWAVPWAPWLGLALLLGGVASMLIRRRAARKAEFSADEPVEEAR